MKKEEAGKDWETFSHNIRWLREKHQFSRTKMAETLRISVKTLDRIEAGEMPDHLTVRILFLVWDYFGIHPVDQLGRRLDEKWDIRGKTKERQVRNEE